MHFGQTRVRNEAVLKAAVKVFEQEGDPMDADDIAVIAKVDAETVSVLCERSVLSRSSPKAKRPPTATSSGSASQRVRPCVLRANGRHQNPSSKA